MLPILKISYAYKKMYTNMFNLNNLTIIITTISVWWNFINCLLAVKRVISSYFHAKIFHNHNRIKKSPSVNINNNSIQKTIISVWGSTSPNWILEIRCIQQQYTIRNMKRIWWVWTSVTEKKEKKKKLSNSPLKIWCCIYC